MRAPAAVPALALSAGALAGIFLPFSLQSAPARLGLGLLWAAAVLLFLRRRPVLFVAAVAIAFAAAGALLGARANAAAQASPIAHAFDSRLPQGEYQLFAHVEGRLRADAAPGPSGIMLDIAADAIEIQAQRFPTSGGLLAGVGGAGDARRAGEWRAGRRVRIPATLRRPARYLDPGVGDAQRDFGWKGIALVGAVKSARLVDLLGRGPRLAEASAAARADVRRSVAAAVGHWSPRSAAVVTAILIGDRAGLDADMQRQLQEAGTYHVIAISGGNIAILAALCAFTLRVARAGPRAAAAAIIIVLLAYALVVGGGASVYRATLMGVVYFTAQLFDHRGTAANVAAVAATLLICIDPLQLTDASFALTFGATLALIVGMPSLPHPFWLPRHAAPAAALLAATACAELALLPVSAFVFSRVTAAGLLLNFAAIPMMSVVQVAGMAAAACAHLSTEAALWCGWVAHWAVRGLLASSALVDDMPWAVRRVPAPSLAIVCAYYSVLIVVVAGRTRRVRATAGASVALCAVWIVAGPAPARAAAAPLRVTFLDVGQGDAAVVQFPDGRSLGVDAGGIAGSSFDIGGRVVSPAYWALGLRRLDYLSLSHGDPDHVGGAPALLADFRPAEVWEGVPVPRHQPMRNLRVLADGAGIPWRTLRRGDQLDIGAVRVSFHHPPRPEWERQRVRNDDSTVMELSYGGVSLVFTGDIGASVEEEIAGAFGRSPIRILKVPHHGSATSSSTAFVRALRPAIAVISAGRGNPFGHPVPDVLDRYRSIGAAIYRTDLDGAVTMETDGRTVRVRTFTGRLLTLRTDGR